MTKIINYKKIMHSASLAAIRTVLTEVSKTGLPGSHHFYITFNVLNDGVDLSKSLRERYPEEMTIVIQNWYDNLVVTDIAFSITLNFGNVREPMTIPFSAIKSFVDPSVEFGLSFETIHDIETEASRENEATIFDNLEDQESLEKTESVRKNTGDVVSLESFRKP